MASALPRLLGEDFAAHKTDGVFTMAEAQELFARVAVLEERMDSLKEGQDRNRADFLTGIAEVRRSQAEMVTAVSALTEKLNQATGGLRVIMWLGGFTLPIAVAALAKAFGKL